MFGADGGLRCGSNDVFAIALWLDEDGGEQAISGGFDGTYTYFAVDGFSYGSTTSNWQGMMASMVAAGKMFVPSVGPGYDDTKIRPWNSQWRRSRDGGKYYDAMWLAALDLRPAPMSVTITSWNEWGEGTQIEPAVDMSINVTELAPERALPLHTRRILRLSVQESLDGSVMYSYSSYKEPKQFLLATSRHSSRLMQTSGLAQQC